MVGLGLGVRFRVRGSRGLGEAEAGYSEVDSAFTQAKVIKVISKVLNGKASGVVNRGGGTSF